MAYADLTNVEKKDIARYEIYLRGLFAQLAQLARDADIDNWHQFAIDNVDDLLAGLDGAEVLPNPTALGGAKDMTVAELLTAQTIARQLTTMLTTNRQLLVKAIGVNAG